MKVRSGKVEIWFPIEKDEKGFPETRDWEGLWSSRHGEEFLIQSIPFYLKNVAYGDFVSAERLPEGYLRFRDVTRRGGYSVYRLLLQTKEPPEEVIEQLLRLDLLVENDGKLIAIAVPPHVDGERIADFLRRGIESRRWGAQDGYIYSDP